MNRHHASRFLRYGSGGMIIKQSRSDGARSLKLSRETLLYGTDGRSAGREDSGRNLEVVGSSSSN